MMENEKRASDWPIKSHARAGAVMDEKTKARMADLAASLATSAMGYAAVIDGVLNIRTVSESENAAALNAIYALGYRLSTTCVNPDCNCMVQALAQIAPGARIVPVTAGVCDG